MTEKEISILGAVYALTTTSDTQDCNLVGNDGYCDPTCKKIVLEENLKSGHAGEIGNIEVYRKQVARHEIIHAFLYESGLSGYAEDECMVDWIAYQFPKLLGTFRETGAI